MKSSLTLAIALFVSESYALNLRATGSNSNNLKDALRTLSKADVEDLVALETVT